MYSENENGGETVVTRRAASTFGGRERDVVVIVNGRILTSMRDRL